MIRYLLPEFVTTYWSRRIPKTGNADVDHDYEITLVLLWATFLFSGVLGALSLFFGNTEIGLISLSLTGVSIIAAMLVHKQYTLAGKLLVVLYTAIIILAQHIYYSGKTNVALYFFPIGLVSLIIFNHQAKWAGYFSASFSTALLILSSLGILPEWNQTITNEQIIYDNIFNTIGASTFSLLSIFYLLRYSEKYRADLEEKSLETRLANENLTLANNTKTRLFSIIGHDLRNPLIAIKGAVSALQEPDFPEEERAFLLSELEKRVDYSMNLMNNLLIWSKAQLNGIEYKPENFDLAELIKTVVGQVQAQAADKRIDLQTDFQHLPLLIFADKGMLEIIIRNIISNSIKYTHQGGFVKVRARKADDHVMITVADSGVGMEQDALEKIRNQVFYTTPGTQREKGSGLGLMICADFLRYHGSDLQIDSGKDAGTRVSFAVREMLDS